MFQYGERMEDTGSKWRGSSIHIYTIKETRMRLIGDKENVWRACSIKNGEDAEQGIDIQGNCLQYAQND